MADQTGPPSHRVASRPGFVPSREELNNTLLEDCDDRSALCGDEGGCINELESIEFVIVNTWYVDKTFVCRLRGRKRYGCLKAKLA